MTDRPSTIRTTQALVPAQLGGPVTPPDPCTTRPFVRTGRDFAGRDNAGSERDRPISTSAWTNPASASACTVSLLSTYPPTQCGLATFAAATRAALLLSRPSWSLPVIRATGSPSTPIVSSPDIAADWRPSDARSLRHVSRRINDSDCLVLQHEYGIYGGNDGNEVLDLLDNTSVPVIAVLHTVLSRPSLGQRRIIAELGRRAACLVVMSDAARDCLLRHYPVPASRVLVIPHGAHPVPYEMPLRKDRRPVLLTWGLVGPGKGLERAIDAVARLHRAGVEIDYRIVGETHPKVREREGEQYRDSLIARASANGVRDAVSFDASYRSVADLVPLIADADLVVVPYDSREQVTSGVLAEALAAGKAIVATAFPHAVEALGSGAGIVVGHDDPVAMADAIGSLLTDPTRIQHMSRVALREGRRMLWPAVGESLATLVESVVGAAATVLDLTANGDRVEAS